MFIRTDGVDSADKSKILPPHMSISEIILMVGIESMNANDDKIVAAYQKVQGNNEKLKEYNKLLAYLAEHKDKDMKLDDKIGDTGKTLKQLLDDNHIEYTKATRTEKIDGRDVTYDYVPKEQESKLETLVKGASDALGGTNQIDMMKLQSVLNKQNEMSQMVSNNMSKMNQMSMALIGNMR